MDRMSAKRRYRWPGYAGVLRRRLGATERRSTAVRASGNEGVRSSLVDDGCGEPADSAIAAPPLPEENDDDPDDGRPA